jgi:hypothetical protein
MGPISLSTLRTRSPADTPSVFRRLRASAAIPSDWTPRQQFSAPLGPPRHPAGHFARAGARRQGSAREFAGVARIRTVSQRPVACPPHGQRDPKQQRSPPSRHRSARCAKEEGTSLSAAPGQYFCRLRCPSKCPKYADQLHQLSTGAKRRADRYTHAAFSGIANPGAAAIARQPWRVFNAVWTTIRNADCCCMPTPRA